MNSKKKNKIPMTKMNNKQTQKDKHNKSALEVIKSLYWLWFTIIAIFIICTIIFILLYKYFENKYKKAEVLCGDHFSINDESAKEHLLNEGTLEQILKLLSENKNGVEIGGPSGQGQILYKNANNLDNVVWSKDTVWYNQEETYNFFPGKNGKIIINDATDISAVKDKTYDFLFASHCLEHIANPLRAIKEWLRIVKHEGLIVIIVPEKSCCFDHKRSYSKFNTLLSQYEKNVNEDDLSTLEEILELHDLSLDPGAPQDPLKFKERCLDNFNNRCLHHYVYNDDLLMEICNYFNCKYIYKETRGLDRWFIMKKN